MYNTPVSSRAQRGTFSELPQRSLSYRLGMTRMLRIAVYFFAAFTGSLTFGMVANSTL